MAKLKRAVYESTHPEDNKKVVDYFKRPKQDEESVELQNVACWEIVVGAYNLSLLFVHISSD